MCSPTSTRAAGAEVEQAIRAAADAWRDWSRMPGKRAPPYFLRAAELLAGPWRTTLNAATMLGQSKTAYQAEIDAAGELIDFWRFNVDFMTRIYEEQPISSAGRLEPAGVPAARGLRLRRHAVQLHGDRRQPADRAGVDGQHGALEARLDRALSAHLLMRLLQGGGPAAAASINLVYGHGAAIGDPALASPDLAGVHFTGSTGVFHSMWRTVGENIDRYRSYPRIVGETGGKDFIVAHPSADADALATAIVRGSFEYQGQKCSAASRVYVAASRSGREMRERLADQVAELKVGDVDDFGNFMGAVIDAARVRDAARRRLDEARANATPGRRRRQARRQPTAGSSQPTVIETTDPGYRLMREELFGPVVTAYVYPDGRVGRDARRSSTAPRRTG